MKLHKFLLCLLFLTFTILFCSAGINDMFVQRKGEQGWVIHVFSQKMPPLQKKNGNLVYDFTYNQVSDSVTILVTLVASSPLKPDRLQIKTCSKNIGSSLESIYCQPKGSHFEYRLKAKITFDQWNDMYKCDKPYTMTFFMRDEAETETCSFAYGNSKLKSNREKLLTIINTVKLNTGK